MIRRGSRALGRREFLAGTGGLVAVLGGLAVGEFTLTPPAAAATAFGYTHLPELRRRRGTEVDTVASRQICLICAGI
jgi:hypothetical protein